MRFLNKSVRSSKSFDFEKNTAGTYYFNNILAVLQNKKKCFKSSISLV